MSVRIPRLGIVVVSLAVSSLLCVPALTSIADARAPGEAPSRHVPALTPGPDDALSRRLEAGTISAARYALERWASIVGRGVARRNPGATAPADLRSGTLFARDLLLRLPYLGTRARARGEWLLARPTDGVNDPDTPFGTDVGYSVAEAPPVCDAEQCIHYVATTANKVPAADTGGTIGVPDHVETVANVMGEVWAHEVGTLGYRPPKGDGASGNDGGDARFDVYLTNLGDDGLFGYCTSDDPHLTNGYRYGDMSAYCVLDNDYQSSEFGYLDPVLPLQVTAAHEFFHGVQFAYDIFDDGWLLEGTAVWIEDEVYDDVNDNLQFLASGSPLTNPTTPLDKNVPARWYGSWIFFRFVSEYFGPGNAEAPVLIRRIWNKADASNGGPDLYSTKAVATVVNNATKGGVDWTFAKAFRDFGVWNVTPAKRYAEGASYDPVEVQVEKTITASVSRFVTVGELDHLTHRYVQLKRASGVAAGANLKVVVNGPPGVTGPVATVVTIRTEGTLATRAVALGADGYGVVTVAFGSGIQRVVVVLANTSTRYVDCYDFAGVYSCNGGTPVDENEVFRVTAKLLQ